ncbi:hypothetical protein L9F63_020066, partial [Diploptera punctata]
CNIDHIRYSKSSSLFIAVNQFTESVKRTSGLMTMERKFNERGAYSNVTLNYKSEEVRALRNNGRRNRIQRSSVIMEAKIYGQFYLDMIESIHGTFCTMALMDVYYS